MSKDVYLLKIDTVCHECKHRNKGEYTLDEPMEIICCGKCGHILSKPECMTADEEEKVRTCIQDALEEED